MLPFNAGPTHKQIFGWDFVSKKEQQLRKFKPIDCFKEDEKQNWSSHSAQISQNKKEFNLFCKQ